jgi:hypothetical protein
VCYLTLSVPDRQGSKAKPLVRGMTKQMGTRNWLTQPGTQPLPSWLIWELMLNRWESTNTHQHTVRMDGVWMKKWFSLYSCSIVNHVLTVECDASTYLVTIMCITYLPIYIVTTYIPYLYNIQYLPIVTTYIPYLYNIPYLPICIGNHIHCGKGNRTMVNQPPPVHHPLDACYYSVVDELQLS